MSLQDGAVYITPDGRRFKAIKDHARQERESGWILVPPEFTGNVQRASDSDILSRFL